MILFSLHYSFAFVIATHSSCSEGRPHFDNALYAIVATLSTAFTPALLGHSAASLNLSYQIMLPSYADNEISLLLIIDALEPFRLSAPRRFVMPVDAISAQPLFLNASLPMPLRSF